jgi:hypothetical protein
MILISYLTNFITIISTILKTIYLYLFTSIDSSLNNDKNSKVKWKEELLDIYYTYSKEEYDRKAFQPFLFHRSFFK